ncbi:MAG: MFS transporter [Bacillota bacterium]
MASTGDPKEAAGSEPAQVEKELTGGERKSIFRSVLSATVGLEFGLGLQRGIFNNFVVETLHIQPDQFGLVQSIREIPGLLTAPLAVVQGFFKENVWAGLCLLITAAGLFLHTMVFSFPMLILATLVLSTGFHLFYPAQSSIMMKSALPEERATRMGQMNSGAAAASLMSVFIVMAISRGRATNYGLLHLIASVFAVVGGILVLTRTMPAMARGKRAMNYDKRFTSYYILTLLGGSRRQITTTFAGYLLVQTFHTPVAVMVLLSAISSIVAIVTRPLIGRIIDSWGEQNSLVVNYSLVTALFVGYALVSSAIPLFIIYILDNGLIGFDVAITTYLGKIAPKEVLSSAYAMGQTVNHITGVSVPVLGGLLWKAFGGPSVFLCGTAIALLSLLYSRGLNKKEQQANA